MTKHLTAYDLLLTLRNHLTDLQIAAQLNLPWACVHSWVTSKYVPHKYFQQLNRMILHYN